MIEGQNEEGNIEYHMFKVNFSPPGIGYMVFGERLNTFDESRKDLMEFQNAAVKLTQSIQGLNWTGSWIKYYPTKPVRDFLEGANYIRNYGMFMVINM